MRHALAAVSEFLLNGETVDNLVQLRGEIGQRHRAEILAAAGADGDGACLHVAVADDQHEGNLLERGLADLLADLLVALVNLYAEALAVELGGGGLGVLDGAVGHGQDLDLHRGQPCGEGTGEVLGDDADEALDRAAARGGS